MIDFYSLILRAHYRVALSLKAKQLIFKFRLVNLATQNFNVWQALAS